jgi:hypothetical protein
MPASGQWPPTFRAVADNQPVSNQNRMLQAISDFAAQLRPLMRGLRAGPEQHFSEDCFTELAIRLFRLQHAANDDYRRLCDARGVSVATVQDWRDIPTVPTSAFKQFAFSCLPSNRRTARFDSSGTTAVTRSTHFHSAESLDLYETSLRVWFDRHLLPDGLAAPRWFLSLTPSPTDAPHSSLVHMLGTVAGQGGFDRHLFAGRTNSRGQWETDSQTAVAFLEEATSHRAPVLLAGTAFNFVDWLDSSRRSMALPAGSRVMETGGYKGRTRPLSKTELHAWIAGVTAVPTEFIVTEYGMTELSSQAYDHAAGERSAAAHLRFPPWTRAMVISAETGTEAQLGEPGLLRIHDLANAFSVAAIETEDLAVEEPGGLRLIGRDPQAEPRGCSLQSVPEPGCVL